MGLHITIQSCHNLAFNYITVLYSGLAPTWQLKDDFTMQNYSLKESMDMNIYLWLWIALYKFSIEPDPIIIQTEANLY